MRNEYKYHTISVLVPYPLTVQKIKNLCETEFWVNENKSLITHFSVYIAVNFYPSFVF